MQQHLETLIRKKEQLEAELQRRVALRLKQKNMDDSVRTLRNNYYLGHYQKVIDEVKEFSSETPAQMAFYYRALLQLRPEEVFQNIDDRAPTALQAIKLLGTYRTAAEDNKELVFETLNEWLQDEILNQDQVLNLIAAQVYFEEGNYKDALKLVASAGEDLEKFAMAVQIYLKIDRVDIAVKTVAAMADIDDDDALTQLCTAWIHIAQGGSKLREASFLLQELMEMFGKSTSLLVTSAVVQLHLANYKEANDFLKMARSTSLENGGKVSADTLVNYTVALQLTKRAPEIVTKIKQELSDSYPGHPYLATQAEMERMFDTHAAKYSL